MKTDAVASTPQTSQAPRAKIENTTDVILMAAQDENAPIKTLVLSPVADKAGNVTKFELSVSDNFKGKEDVALVQQMFDQLLDTQKASDFQAPIPVVVKTADGEERLGTNVTQSLASLQRQPELVEAAPRQSAEAIDDLLVTTEAKLHRIDPKLASEASEAINQVRPDLRGDAESLAQEEPATVPFEQASRTDSGRAAELEALATADAA